MGLAPVSGAAGAGGRGALAAGRVNSGYAVWMTRAQCSKVDWGSSGSPGSCGAMCRARACTPGVHERELPGDEGPVPRPGDEGPRPSPGATREAGREHLRVTPDECPVAPRRADHPASANLWVAFRPDGHGGGPDVCKLPVERSGGRPDVRDGVPALDQHEHRPPLVAKADVSRERRVAGTRGQLERSAPARVSCEAQDQLLHQEMARVDRLVVPIAREPHAELPIQRDGEPLPGRKRQRAAEPALDLADTRLAHPRSGRQLALGPVTTHPGAANVRPELGQQCPLATSGLGEHVADPGPRHIPHSIAGCAYGRLTACSG